MIVRSERFSAGLLLVAALLGVILANTGIGPALLRVKDMDAGILDTGLDLSVGAWISDGLLAIFFFMAAIELKSELTIGQLNTFKKAIRPGIAAGGGVLAPALIYVAFNLNTPYLQGWPIPTATDIAFSLGILAMFGRFLPSRLRTFILALAILDDLIAIIFIAALFTETVQMWFIVAAAACIVAFGLLSMLAKSGHHRWVIAVLIPLGLAAWVCMYMSGVHATIAGVGLGLALAGKPADRAHYIIEPVSNGIVLPLFAFEAALVAIPSVPVSGLPMAFWGILVALPVGKVIGITVGSWVSGFIDREQASEPFPEMITAGLLGGIGFTVSLLMNELAFHDKPEVADEGILAVLLGSTIAIIAAAVAVILLGRHYRQHFEQHPPSPEKQPSA